MTVTKTHIVSSVTKPYDPKRVGKDRSPTHSKVESIKAFFLLFVS